MVRIVGRLATLTTRIQRDRSGPLATRWLDRPDKRNALDAALMKQLGCAWSYCAGGGAAFSSGIDHALLAEVFAATQQSPFLHPHH